MAPDDPVGRAGLAVAAWEAKAVAAAVVEVVASQAVMDWAVAKARRTTRRPMWPRSQSWTPAAPCIPIWHTCMLQQPWHLAHSSKRLSPDSQQNRIGTPM